MSGDWFALRDALAFQVECGAGDAILDAPIDRFEQQPQEPRASESRTERLAEPQQAARPAPPVPDTARIAAACATLDALRDAMSGFDGCALKKGAINFVFSDGNPAARLMVIGEAPGAEEDRLGKPFVGPSGKLLDRMLAAIGLDRASENPETAVYITNVIPWRPPANRDPSSDEVAMMRPFLMRHIELAAPEALLLLGNPSMKTVLETSAGITRMRGTWHDVLGVPAMPSFHPAALLRDPQKKAAAWADLLSLKAKLEGRT
ncbi:MAG: uracil-DNA glycosylase [Rubricella sp.]